MGHLPKYTEEEWALQKEGPEVCAMIPHNSLTESWNGHSQGGFNKSFTDDGCYWYEIETKKLEIA